MYKHKTGNFPIYDHKYINIQP